jgi:hypothetical protein
LTLSPPASFCEATIKNSIYCNYHLHILKNYKINQKERHVAAKPLKTVNFWVSGRCKINHFGSESTAGRIALSVENSGLWHHLFLGFSRLCRSDKIAWTDGVHPPCPNLRHLIQLLDSIVLTANRQRTLFARIRIPGSMLLTNGSGFGSGSCYLLVSDPSRCQQKNN